MRAAVFQGEGVVTVVDREMPRVTEADDVVIAVDVNGVCGSDLRALAVPPQMVYDSGVVVGHEFAGRVVDAGTAVSSIADSDRVVAIPNINCQVCWYCTTNRTNLCESFIHIGSMRDGGAADMVKVPERLVLKIPDGLSTELAALTEPLACVLNGTVSAGAQPGDTVLVFGAGPIGLLYMLVFIGAGARVVVSEPSPNRRKKALELGAHAVIDPAEDDVPSTVRDLSAGRGADIAVDSVGHLLADAVASVRKGGKVMVFGLDERSRAEISPVSVAYGEVRIEGVYIAKGTFPTALRLLEQNELGFHRLITHRVGLDQFNDAIDLTKTGEAIKAVVTP